MEAFQPMLSGKVKDTAKLLYPVVISPKLDGIRAVNIEGDCLVSRNLKAIPNLHVQELLANPVTRYFDGELICGDPRDKECYNKTYRAVMAKEGKPDVKLYVFDHFRLFNEPFFDRLQQLPATLPANVVLVEQHVVQTEEELLSWEQRWLDEGYEGLMVRSLTGPYKFGRSTDREGVLLKLKRFVDDDCEIIGAEELMRNGNEATKDALGRTERSSHKENLVPAGLLGALQVRDVKSGVEFNIGTGFILKDRAQMWADHTGKAASYDEVNPDNPSGPWITRTAQPSGTPLVGRFGKYKSFKIGVKDKPRFPVWLGFRAKEDMS